MGVAEGSKKLFFQKRRAYPTKDLSILLKSSEKHHRRKIARDVAAEDTSAARVDASRKSTNGPIGQSRRTRSSFAKYFQIYSRRQLLSEEEREAICEACDVPEE
ncbi:hypothetical protein V1478_003314 [Vespula squamosa]|uniref:Uncharacterized protein n=1 Tax=Vespula squamosa TaxID=30214 RepID=A0ABD2BPX2_VESSQ